MASFVSRPMRSLSMLALVISGCGAACGCSSPQSGGQTGSEPAGCLPIETRQLALDERSPSGFSADEALASMADTWVRPFTWAKGGETDLTVAVAYAGDGTVRWHDREWTSPENGQEAAQGNDCLDAVEMDVSIDFTTADGAFAESWTGILTATTSTEGTHSHPLDPSAMGGSYQVTEVDPAQYDEVDLSVSIGFQDAWVLGSVDGIATDVEGSGDDGVVSGTPFSIGTF